MQNAEITMAIDGGFENPWMERLRQDQAEFVVEAAIKARQQEALYDYVAWKYRPLQDGAGTLLERCGETYPVMVFPLQDESQMDQLDSILYPNLLERPAGSRDLAPRITFRHVLTRAQRFRDPTVNRPTFAMSKLYSDGMFKLECFIGDYFASFDTCDVLEWELLLKIDKLHGRTGEAFEGFERHLPLRRRLHEEVSDPVREGRLRTAGIAISTLIIAYDGRTYTPILRRRSRRAVAAHPRGIHVIPSFMFQATNQSFVEQEYSVVHNVKREYLEELFSKEEFDQHALRADQFRLDPRLRPLERLLETGEAELLLTGFAVNLLTMRPEICTLLLIHSSRWFGLHVMGDDADMRFKFNVETLETLEDQDGDEPGLGILELGADPCSEMRPALGADRMVPSGAAAYWLGVDLARRLLKLNGASGTSP